MKNYIVLIFLWMFCLYTIHCRPGASIRERHKIHVPVPIKTVYVTKVIKVPEHHHHHHHEKIIEKIEKPIKMKMEHFPDDPWSHVEYDIDHGHSGYPFKK